MARCLRHCDNSLCVPAWLDFGTRMDAWPNTIQDVPVKVLLVKESNISINGLSEKQITLHGVGGPHLPGGRPRGKTELV